jgi:hypothetical protein
MVGRAHELGVYGDWVGSVWFLGVELWPMDESFGETALSGN